MVQFYENKDMLIKCPLCGTLLVVVDKRDPKKNRVKCRMCNVLVHYTPATEEVYTSKVPARTTSSGMTFY